MILIIYRPQRLFEYVYQYPFYPLQLLRIFTLLHLKYTFILAKTERHFNKILDKVTTKNDFNTVVYIDNSPPPSNLAILKIIKNRKPDLKVILCSQIDNFDSAITEGCDEIITGDYRLKLFDFIKSPLDSLNALPVSLQKKEQFPWPKKAEPIHHFSYSHKLFSQKKTSYAYYLANKVYEPNWLCYHKKFILNNLSNYLDPGQILDEIIFEFSEKQEENETIFFMDRCLNFSPDWLAQFCALKKKYKFEKPWIASFNLENLTLSEIKMMHSAGLNSLISTIASGGQDTLQKRTINYGRINQNIELCKSYKIRLLIFWEIGYPEDSRSTIKEYYEQLIENNIYNFEVLFLSLATPLKDTLFFEYYRENSREENFFSPQIGALIHQNWVNSNKNHYSVGPTKYLSGEELNSIFNELTVSLKTKFFRENFKKNPWYYIAKGIVKPKRSFQFLKSSILPRNANF